MEDREYKYGDKVYLQGTFIKGFEEGTVRISFAPELDKREFPIFEMNIPKDAILSRLQEPKQDVVKKVQGVLISLASDVQSAYMNNTFLDMLSRCHKALEAIKPFLKGE